MIDELLCPDCGGVVGATEATEAGPACRCFVPKRDRSGDTFDGHATAMGVAGVGDGSIAVEAPVVPLRKICRICGADVAGKKRYKDHLGYTCDNCNTEQERKEFAGRIPCPVCQHLVKEESLARFDGVRMCAPCRAERRKYQEGRFKQIGIRSVRDRYEKASLLQLLLILGVLLLVILASALIVHLRHH